MAEIDPTSAIDMIHGNSKSHIVICVFCRSKIYFFYTLTKNFKQILRISDFFRTFARKLEDYAND